MTSTSLTQDQLTAVKKIIGPNGESRIDETLSKLQQKYANGHITEDQFSAKLNPTSSYKSLEMTFCKRLFAAIDLDNSRTIDFNEYLTAFALLSANNLETKLKWFFLLCDSDHDGLVNKDDVVDVITILLVISTADPASAQASEEEVQKTKNTFEQQSREMVEKLFDGKTQMAEEEFRRDFPEKEGQFVDRTANYLSGIMITGLL